MDNLEAHEEYIGLHPLEGSADNVFPMIKEVLLCLNFDILDARGQCYDGAGAMMGGKSGVATRLKKLILKC